MIGSNAVVQYGVPLIIFILSSFVGGILMGIDRKVTARLQHREGPPIIQPFYDVLKLFGKDDKIVNKPYLIFGVAYVLTVILSVILLLFKYDLLVTVFIFGLSFTFLVLAGFSVRSQFSYVGATRELLQMLTYEPILLLVVFLIRLKTGSFEISSIYTAQPLLYTLPFALLALFLILPIKARKSPFDISDAHQEIAQGPETEFSGKYLGLLTIASFYEFFFILWFIGLFFVQNIAIRLLLMLVAFIFLLLVDNATARFRVDQMLKKVLIGGIILFAINLIWILATGGWVV